MKPGQRTVFIKKQTLHSAAAILLIVLAMADICFPQVCCDEVVGIPASKSSAVDFVARAEATVLITSDGLHQEQAPLNEADCDDCFCCCSHILPGTSLAVSAIDLRLPVTDIREAWLPSPPASETYHPPRRG